MAKTDSSRVLTGSCAFEIFSRNVQTRMYEVKNFHLCDVIVTLGTRGNSLAKSGRPKAGETSVRSEVSEASEGPNASSLWWRTPTVSLC